MDPMSSAGSADVGGILRAAHGWGVGEGELDTHVVISERLSHPRSTGHCLRRIGSGLSKFGTAYCLRHTEVEDMIILRMDMLFQA